MEDCSAASKVKKDAREKLKESMREHGIERVSLEDGTDRDFVLVEEQNVKIKKHKPATDADRSAENAVD